MKRKVILDIKATLLVANIENIHKIGYIKHDGIKLFILASKKQGGYITFSNVECDTGQLNGSIDGGQLHSSVKDAVMANIDRVDTIYVFDTIKELFAWLSE